MRAVRYVSGVDGVSKFIGGQAAGSVRLGGEGGFPGGFCGCPVRIARVTRFSERSSETGQLFLPLHG